MVIFHSLTIQDWPSHNQSTTAFRTANHFFGSKVLGQNHREIHAWIHQPLDALRLAGGKYVEEPSPENGLEMLFEYLRKFFNQMGLEKKWSLSLAGWWICFRDYLLCSSIVRSLQVLSMAMQQDPIDWRYRFHIFLAYISGLLFRAYPHNSYGQTYGTFTYLHLLDPEDLPLILEITGITGTPFSDLETSCLVSVGFFQ